MSDWTAEQLRNAMTYGICLTCLAPREARTWDDEHGTVFAIVCPNGHNQDAWAEFDARPILPE